MAGLRGKKIDLDFEQKTKVKELICARYLIEKEKSVGLLVVKINKKNMQKNPNYVKVGFWKKVSRQKQEQQTILLSDIEVVLGPGYVVEGHDIVELGDF